MSFYFGVDLSIRNCDGAMMGYRKVVAVSFRPSAVGRENCRFFAVFPTILSRLMFFNYVHTASLKSAMLLY